MPYVLLALAAVMFGLYNVFIKLLADHIQAILGAVVLQFVAAFLGLGLLAYFKYTDQISLYVSPRGITLAVLAGIGIRLIEILSIILYVRSVGVAIGHPVIVSASLSVTTGVSWMFLREALNPWQVAAVFSRIGGGAVL